MTDTMEAAMGVALLDFNEGFAAGLSGSEKDKSRSATWRNAYDRGRVARREEDYWAEKRA